MKNFFSIITVSMIILSTTSCGKESVLAQVGQVGQDPTSIALPIMTGISADGSVASIYYNGQTVSVSTIHEPIYNNLGQVAIAGDFDGNGVMTQPMTRPAQWLPNNAGTGYIADGSNFNYGSSDKATVWYVQGTYTGAGFSYSLRSTTMQYLHTPETSSDYSAYVAGRTPMALKTGWIGQVTFKITPYQQVYYWTIIN